MEQFKNYKGISIIVNVNILGEGIDIKEVDCVCFLEDKNSYF